MAIVIPKNEMNEFSLPRVCIATGKQGVVTFQKAEFVFAPKWIAIFALAPLIYLIVYYATRKTASGALPFSEEAWAASKAARRNIAIAAVVMVVGIVVSIALMNVNEGLGFLLLMVAFFGGLVGIGVSTRRFQKTYPRATFIDDNEVHLIFPSPEAEDLVRAHLSSGTRSAA